MTRKIEKPFDKLLRVRTTLPLYIEYGDRALQGKSLQEFIVEVNECFELLMTFRNIINGMVSFDEAPEHAVLQYLPDPT
jgi:hypothetical protein